MKSFLREMEDKFLELEEYCDSCDRTKDQCVCDNELEEISTTGAVAGYNTPNAFSKTGADDDTVEALGMKRVRVKESVNKPPSWTMGAYQSPEDSEEEYTDKFPFAETDGIWQHKNYQYPSKDLTKSPGTANKKDKTKLTVEDVLEKKYEQLIESYRSFANGDPKTTPEQKIKETIKTVAKKLQEIEQTVNYASKLKTESGVNRTGYGSAVESALNKISNRLIKISERVRALGE